MPKCEFCEMSYIQENPEEVREHEVYHDNKINGLTAIISESDKVVWAQDDKRIIVLDRFCPLDQFRQAEDVAMLARMDTPYGAEDLFGESEFDTHVFLLQRQNRIIGLLTIEKRPHIWKTSWADFDAGKESNELLAHPPMWSICFVWILKRHRGSNLGQTMINKAVAYVGESIETIGWYTPFTDSGDKLVRKCCPGVFYIAK